MKGLLRKDFYMACKYCRAYLFIVVVFLMVSLFGDDNAFMVFYPCLLAGMVPVNLLAYDENSKWHIYSGTLPCTRGQLVSVKYLIGVITQVTVLVLTGIVQAVRMCMADPHIRGGFDLTEWAVTMGVLVIMSAVSSSVSMPFMFRYGVEKGRIAYYVMIGVACAGMMMIGTMGNILPGSALFSVPAEWMVAVGVVLAIGIYALSWYLSIVFYNKRELN